MMAVEKMREEKGERREDEVNLAPRVIFFFYPSADF